LRNTFCKKYDLTLRIKHCVAANLLRLPDFQYIGGNARIFCKTAELFIR